ncbi:shikimate kinase [Pelistega europaea]|nr:shikimate kinase [Pelistega europaea]
MVEIVKKVDNNSCPIIVIGMMGAGKTTIGRALAREMGLNFVDLDHEIVRRSGVAIPTIFDIEGEEGFRRRETQALSDTINQPNIVLATGGGAILREENRALLRQGIVIYLKASVDELYARVAKDANRPLLQTENPRERIAQLLEIRHPIYEMLADITLETKDGSIPSAVKRLKQALTEL